jgi:hypothetical protein
MIRFESPSRRTPLLVSQQIDHVLLTAKQEEICHEMQLKSLAAKNSAKNDYQWANAELSVVEEWAEKLFAAWIQIWDTQGLPRCHALYRAIFENELRNLFASRNAVFKGQRSRLALIDRSRVNDNAIEGWFRREMDRISAKWNRRMDVESRKSMYAARREMSEAQASRAIATPPLAPPRAAAVPPNPSGLINPTPNSRRLNYRSPVRRAIQAELTKNPRATNLAILGAFDDNGSVDLPKGWQPKPGDREFVKAYRNDKRIRPKIEKAISKVRKDMRGVQLLPLR